ncbi:hypothetical protein O4G98_12350 [Zoogloeaceae bacterium G21618-S1]|nr:hypothetical protein [Zoogloeaceae bacterium G21618-S1]
MKYRERSSTTETDAGGQIDIRGTGQGMAITRNRPRAQRGKAVPTNADGGGLRPQLTLNRAG